MTTVTVTGKYLYGDKPAQGRVVITPNVDTVYDANGNVIIYGSYIVNLDANGAFSINLPVTDDPNNNPLNFDYILEAQLSKGIVPAITFGLPASVGPTLDLSDKYPDATGDANYIPVLQGFSAYQMATRNGFVGTEQEWLDSLIPQFNVNATSVEWGTLSSATIDNTDIHHPVLSLKIEQGMPGSGTFTEDINDSTIVVAQANALTKRLPSLDGSDLLPEKFLPVDVAKKGDLVVNVKDYGAVGDGATDDTAAIQAALNAGRHGTVILAPNSTYIVTGVLDTANVVLEGNNSTIKIKDGTTPAYSVISPSSECIIKNLVIDLNKANTIDPAVQTQGNGLLMNQAAWNGLEIHNVTVINGHQVGIHIYSTGANDADSVPSCRTILDNVIVDSCTVSNFSIKTVRSVTVKNCKSVNSGGANFYLSVVGDSEIRNCRALNGTGAGIFIEYCQDVAVVNNLCEGNTVQGIAIGGGSDILRENRNITVSGNICRSNGSIGITVDPTKAAGPNTWVAVYSTLVNNICESNGSNGINLENAAHVSIVGNVCHANTGSGLRIIGAYVNATGNVLTGNQSYGLALYGVAGHDNGHHNFGVNTSLNNAAGNYDIGSELDGSVSDIVSRVPGSLRTHGTLNANMDSTIETYIGAAGPTGQAGIDMYGNKLYSESNGVIRTGSWIRAEGNIQAGFNGAGGWSDAHLTIGPYHLWVDSTGELRIKNGSPTSDLDGVTVGSQA